MTDPNVPVLTPPLRVKTTVSPPVLREFPAASRPCKVATIALPDATDAALSVTVEVTAEIAPAETVTVGDPEVTVVAFTVALIVVAVPARTPVKIAV